jgi:hypothetical protein
MILDSQIFFDLMIKFRNPILENVSASVITDLTFDVFKNDMQLTDTVLVFLEAVVVILHGCLIGFRNKILTSTKLVRETTVSLALSGFLNGLVGFLGVDCSESFGSTAESMWASLCRVGPGVAID